MRILTRRSTRSHSPFTGQGTSLYVNGAFRRLRVDCGVFTAGTETTIGGNNVQKTSRVASAADPAKTYVIDSTVYANQTVEFQVRTYANDVENESDFRSLTITFDADGNDATTILGRGVLLSTEQRAGGIVRLRFLWVPDRSGLQPTSFLAIRTAGPSSPANATISTTGVSGVYEINTPALLDTSAYTYKLQAKNGSTTYDFLTGISVLADATGPAQPVNGTVEII